MGERVLEFEVLMEPDEDGIRIWCPALKGCQSFGLTREEALANIKEAIELWLDDDDDSPLPESSRVTVRVPVDVP
jgi:predicted RNase H-like HicB family nuclease